MTYFDRDGIECALAFRVADRNESNVLMRVTRLSFLLALCQTSTTAGALFIEYDTLVPVVL